MGVKIRGDHSGIKRSTWLNCMGPFSLWHTHSHTHTYPSQLYSGVPLGYLLELFHRGPCLLEWVFLAARASKRSHRLLTRKGYPRPLGRSQALLPGSGFTSKRRGVQKCIFQLNPSPHYTNWGGGGGNYNLTAPLYHYSARVLAFAD